MRGEVRNRSLVTDVVGLASRLDLLLRCRPCQKRLSFPVSTYPV